MEMKKRLIDNWRVGKQMSSVSQDWYKETEISEKEEVKEKQNLIYSKRDKAIK